jgi:dihydroflavonol-4-reductase
MPTALVTGASGCVGSSLALRLAAIGYNLRILRRSSSDLRYLGTISRKEFVGDICDDDTLRRAMEGCDIVFHTAALVSFARKTEDEQRRVNVLGTRAVVGACLASGVKTLVHTSSVTTIGHASPGEAADEASPADHSHARGYRLSKVLAEDEVWNGTGLGLHAVIVNPSVIIGERDTRFHAGQLIRDIKKGRIPFYIDGGMNVTYVGDVVSGMLLAAAKGRRAERYILGGENLSHREIFLRTSDLIGGRRPRARLPLPVLRGIGRIVESGSRLLGIEPALTADLAAVAGHYNWFSSAKAVRELGYTMTPFDQAILAAYAWYKENGYVL